MTPITAGGIKGVGLAFNMSTALETYVLVSIFMIKMSANFDSRILKDLQPVPAIGAWS